MPLDSVDVTVVLNGHREGLLIHRTLRSILRAVDFAQDRDIRCEIVAVLDRPDRATRDYFERLERPDLRVLEVAYGDTALARNRGVDSAAGHYVAFVDGDDLVSANWFAEAFRFAEREWNDGRSLVLHPELSVFFGADSSVLIHVDQESPGWCLSTLFAANYWTALAFARKADLIAVPFRQSDSNAGFGYEDWDWNCLAVGAGMIHKVVPATWHFIRLKTRGSRNRIAQERDLLTQPSPLFDRLECEAGGTHRAAPAVAGEGENLVGGGINEFLARPSLLAEWRELARIEPELFPSKETLTRYRFWQPSNTEVGDAFGEILRCWGPAPSHVLFSGRFAQGEAGHIASNYVYALLEAGAEVLVVAERFGAARPNYATKGSLRTIEIDRLAVGLGSYWRTRLIAQALIQRPPRTVHLIESALGYEAIAAYGAAIASGSRIFASASFLGCAPDGGQAGLAALFFDRIVHCLSGLLGDSQAVLDWHCDTFGFPRERCRLLRSALNPSVRFVDPGARKLNERPTAMWIGDHGRQACPSLLLQIAERMPDWDFVIFRHSEGDFPWSDEVDTALRAAPNISKAPSDRSLNQQIGSMNALLHTSLLDGPLSLLIDAAASGMPIVAPSRVALREFLNDGNGYPVRDYCRPEAYVARLRQVAREPEKAAKRVQQAQRRIQKEYSWRRFVEAMQSIDGYL